MKKRVWILNHHANDMFFEDGGRHYFLAKYLMEAGYDPVIFCSNAEHGTNKLYFPNLELWEQRINEKSNIPFVFIKGRPYVGNGKNRIFCMIDYYVNMVKVAKEYSKINGKPDIIIGSQVHPFAVLVAEKLAKKYGVKCIAEFRDLWPESIVAMGIVKAKNPLVIGLRMLEKYLYKNADAIIFTMEGGYDYIVERKWDKMIDRKKVYYINNGVDLESYYLNRREFDFLDDDLEDEQAFKVIYTGSIRQANGLEALIESAIKFKENNKVKFIIFGDGDYREKLEKRIEQFNLKNVHIKGKVDKKYIPSILAKGDLNLLNYNAKAAMGFFRFGSSQNKLFEYFASGKPILSNFKSNYDLIEKYGCGISKSIEDSSDYVVALNEFICMDETRYQEMCNKSCKAAKDYDFRKLANSLIEIIESL